MSAISEIPPTVSEDIRDKWDDKTYNSLMLSVEAVEDTLGYKIEPVVEWSTLWSSLKEQEMFNENNSTFVPTVMGVAVAWFDRFSGRLESKVHQDWTDDLLDVIGDGEIELTDGIKLYIEPASTEEYRPTTRWNEKTQAFHLAIPKTPLPSAATLDKGFDKDFEDMFNAAFDSPIESAIICDNVMKAIRPSSIEDVVELQLPPKNYSFLSTTSTIVASKLPTVEILAHPSELFAAAGSQNLTVNLKESSIELQSSHEISLQLIQAYFTKWSSAVSVTLEESDFCLGVHDSLTIERSSKGKSGVMNPSLLISFVEGVLGFRRIFCDGVSWVYEKDSEDSD